MLHWITGYYFDEGYDSKVDRNSEVAGKILAKYSVALLILSKGISPNIVDLVPVCVMTERNVTGSSHIIGVSEITAGYFSF